MEQNQPYFQGNQPVNNNSKLLLIGSFVVIAVIAVMTSLSLQSQQKMLRESQAGSNVYPTQAPLIPTHITPKTNVTQGKINSKEGLMNALEELEKENGAATNQIQILINNLEPTP